MRVGVIVAARAPVPWLGEALASVLSQAPAPDDVVVVDHASSPALEEVAGVRVVRLESAAGGPAAARQAGLRALDTELVALADADDLWEPGKLVAQVELLRAAPDVDVCFGRALVIDADGAETGELLPELPAGVVADAGRVLYERNAIPAASAVIRREALELVGGFVPAEPLPAATDWDLWLRLAAAGRGFACEPGARIRYRRHPGGVTSSVVRLAAAGLAIHERHASLVDEATARRARGGDLVTLARGQIRDRRYGDARRTLSAAAALRPPTTRERALRATAGIPIARRALGRRNPYR